MAIYHSGSDSGDLEDEKPTATPSNPTLPDISTLLTCGTYPLPHSIHSHTLLQPQR